MRSQVWGEVARAVEGKRDANEVVKAMGEAALVLWRGGWDEYVAGSSTSVQDAVRRLRNTRARANVLRGLSDRIGELVLQPVRRDGQVVGALIVGEELVEGAEALAIIVGQALDGTEQRAAAQKLQREVWKLRQQLRESNRHRTALLSQARHDLRTPLTALKGYADMINRGMAGPVTPTLKRYVDRIGRAIERECEILDQRLGADAAPAH